jgi:hypothetical protein
MNFFPFLWFLKMLKDRKHADVKGEMIDVEFFEVAHWKDLDIDDKEKERYLDKFQSVKRLITLHWLDGVPLWDCLTSLRPDTEEIQQHDDRYYQGYCTSRDILGDWLWAVREVVALYTIRPSVWRTLSIEHLQVYNFVRGRDVQC